MHHIRAETVDIVQKKNIFFLFGCWPPPKKINDCPTRGGAATVHPPPSHHRSTPIGAAFRPTYRYEHFYLPPGSKAVQ